MARMKPGPEAVHWFAEAGRLAFADRALYLGDPFFTNVPVKGLVDPDYLKSRAALVSPDKSMGKAQAGDPPFQKTERPLPAGRHRARHEPYLGHRRATATPSP